MSQVSREVRPITRRPRGVTLGVRALVGPVAVSAVKVEQEVDLAGGGVVEVSGRPLDAALDGGAGAAGAGPGAEEARGGDLDEDRLAGLVLHEAQESLIATSVGGREREDGEVDYVGGGVVDVGLGRCEGLEVGCVGVADLGV